MKSRLNTLIFLMLIPVSFYSQAANGRSLHGGGADTLVHGKPKMLSNQFSFTEGPAADRQGNVYFTDQPNNNIWKYGTDGKLTLFMDSTGRSNGMYFDRKGNLITCADEHDQLWSISPDKKVQVLVTGFHGKRLNGPNDVWVAPNGGIYFTDPYYQRSYWKRTAPDIKSQNVYYLPPDAAEPVIAADDLQKPNGVVGTPDGKHLFIADIQAGKTYKYDIAKDGSLIHRELFVNQGSDGLTIDEKGDLYLTGKGVTIYNPKGVKIGHISIPQPWTSNVCFGGKNRDQLFITASKAVYMVQMEVKGAM